MTYYAYKASELGPYRANPLDHYGLAVKIARDLPRPHHLTVDDMVQEALTALCTAARTYDEGQGVPFGAWAAMSIRNHLAGVRSAYWRMAALVGRNQLPREVWEHFAGEEPSCDPSVIGPLLRASRRWHGATDYDCGVVAQVVTHTDSSLDETWDHREGIDAPSAKVPLVETVPDPRSEDPYWYWEENRDAERVVRKALVGMNEREREICLARVLDVDTDTTLDDFGERWGVTRQRVQQIEAGAVAKLKRAWKVVHGA